MRRNNRMDFDCEIEQETEEFGTVRIYAYGCATRETPDVMYLSNGDPGYPGDPAEVNFDHVTACQLDENGDDGEVIYDQSRKENKWEPDWDALWDSCYDYAIEHDYDYDDGGGAFDENC